MSAPIAESNSNTIPLRCSLPRLKRHPVRDRRQCALSSPSCELLKANRAASLLAGAGVTHRTREIHRWINKSRHHLHIFHVPVETIEQRVQTAREFKCPFAIFRPGAAGIFHIGQIRSILQNYFHLTFRARTQRPGWFTQISAPTNNSLPTGHLLRKIGTNTLSLSIAQSALFANAIIVRVNARGGRGACHLFLQ